MSRWTAAGAIVCILLVLAWMFLARWFRLNVSASIPLGLYRVHTPYRPLAPGMLVQFDVPSSVSVFHPSGLPLVKPVVGLPGSIVCDVDDVYRVDAEFYGPVYSERDGLPLPRFRGCYEAPPYTVIVATRVLGSLDSRYFGPLHEDAVVAILTPVLTW